VARHERLEAIEKARDAFDHTSQQLHDDEMAAGADSALAKHLTFVVYQQHHTNAANRAAESAASFNEQRLREQQQRSFVSEISMTLDAMESLYRASSEIVGASFRRMGNRKFNSIPQNCRRCFFLVCHPSKSNSNAIYILILGVRLLTNKKTSSICWYELPKKKSVDVSST